MAIVEYESRRRRIVRMNSRIREFQYVGKEFLSSTSMHGLQYIAEEKRSIVERFMWALIFTIGVAASFYFCWVMWIKFETSPVMLSVETTDLPLEMVEFPAVTICNQNKVSRRKLSRILKEPKYRDFTADQMIFMMRTMIKVDSAFNRTQEVNTLQQLFTRRGISADDLVNTSLQVMITCEDMLLECQWQNQVTPCQHLFVLRPTDDGLCCGFNHLEPDWNDSRQQNPYEIAFQAPRRVPVAGLKNGLTVVLDSDLEDYAAATGRSDGFKVFVHNAREYPEVAERGFAVSPGFEVYAGMEAFSTHSTDDIYRLTIAQRQCYTDQENPLQFYANYSASRCMMECMTQHMLRQCNCRPFYYSAKATDPVCNFEDYTCISQAYGHFRQNGMESSCQCYPLCDDLWFGSQLSLGSFPGRMFMTSRMAERLIKRKQPDVLATEFEKYLSKNGAILNVFYREQVSLLYRADIRFGIEDFISAMGGLLGLGFGFSFISLVEILYFFGIRWYFNRRMNQVRLIRHPIFTHDILAGPKMARQRRQRQPVKPASHLACTLLDDL